MKITNIAVVAVVFGVAACPSTPTPSSTPTQVVPPAQPAATTAAAPTPPPTVAPPPAASGDLCKDLLTVIAAVPTRYAGWKDATKGMVMIREDETFPTAFVLPGALACRIYDPHVYDGMTLDGHYECDLSAWGERKAARTIADTWGKDITACKLEGFVKGNFETPEGKTFHWDTTEGSDADYVTKSIYVSVESSPTAGDETRRAQLSVRRIHR